MKKLLGISISNHSNNNILEQIEKYLSSHTQFCHVVSLNPENMVIAQKSHVFKKIIEAAQIKIIDGVGVVLAARMLNIPIEEKLTGVDLMDNLIVLAKKSRLTVLFVGGRPNLALRLAQCYQDQFPEATFVGTEGFKNIQKPTRKEELKILSIVRSIKPNLIFAAFGSPWQELWLARRKKEFKGIVCMGVGQGFDVASGMVKRAPAWVQKIGLEWVYRLITQPWRWRRQLRLIEFIWLVTKQKFSSNHEK